MPKSSVENFIGQKLTLIVKKLTIILSLFVSLYANESISLGLTGVTLKDDITTLMNMKEYLSEKTALKIDLKFAKSYSIMQSYIINESVDIAYICGSTFVDLQKKNEAQLLVIPIVNGLNTYSSFVITRKDALYKNLFDLKDKIFAMSDPESNSGSIVPFYEIMKKGYKKNDFFKQIIFTYDHGESIVAVLDGFVEAASVDSVIYKAFLYGHPQLKDKIKIIDDFSGYPMPPFVVRKNVDANIKNKLQQVLLNMHKDSVGKSLLKAMAIDRFELPKNISYEKINEVKEFVLRNDNDK